MDFILDDIDLPQNASESQLFSNWMKFEKPENNDLKDSEEIVDQSLGSDPHHINNPNHGDIVPSLNQLTTPSPVSCPPNATLEIHPSNQINLYPVPMTQVSSSVKSQSPVVNDRMLKTKIKIRFDPIGKEYDIKF